MEKDNSSENSAPAKWNFKLFGWILADTIIILYKHLLQQ